jgi:hypothetical protein
MQRSKTQPFSPGGLHSAVGIEFIAFYPGDCFSGSQRFDCSAQTRLAENEAAKLLRI